MAIVLDEARPDRAPVLQPRDFGAVTVLMIAQKEIRQRNQRVNNELIRMTRPDGRPMMEEVLTGIVLDGTTALAPDDDPLSDGKPVPVGSVARWIAKSRAYGALIDARKNVGGTTQVGDVITIRTTGATVWRGQGDLVQAGVTDPDALVRARAKGLTIGWDLEVTYRRALPTEAALVAQAEALYHELAQSKAISLDQGAAARPQYEDESPF